MLSKHKIVLTLLLLATIQLVSCSQKDQLFIYASLDEAVAQRLFNAFEVETGSKVHFVRLSTGEAAARIEAEKNNPQASLWVGGVGLGHTQIKHKGLSVPYSPKGLEKIPPQYVDPEHFWTGLYIGIIAFVANQDQLQKHKLAFPTAWQDLLQPKYKGFIQLANPGTSGTAYNVITTLVKLYGEGPAMDYLKKLHKNISQYTRSGAAPVKNAVLGETILALGYSHDAIRLIYESKAPLKIGFPSEGTGFEIASISLLKGAKQPELAKKLYDFVLSSKAAQIFADDYYAPFIRDGVTLKPEIIDVNKIKLIQTDIEWDGKNKDRLVELWNDQINS